MRKKKINLITDPVAPTIMKMAGGMLFGMIAMSAFNAADTYFVGQLGVLELAAMSFTFPVVMILNSISLGLGVGLSSTVSRAIGAGDHHRVQRLTTDGLVLSLLIVLVLGFIGIMTIRPLFELLGAHAQTLELVHDYMIIWYFGIPFVVIPMAGNNVIRATGDTLTPSMIMIISVVVNIILDPLLIFGLGPFPAMGIGGAATATVCARFTTFIASLCVLKFREGLLTFERVPWSETLDSWKQIAFVGVPAGLVQAINPLSMSIITRLLARYGERVVAGFGAAGRVEMLVTIIPASLASVMAPFTGQNWGARQVCRITKALKFSSLVSIAWGGIVFVLFLFFADSIIGLFNADPTIIRAGGMYLQTVGISYGFLGMLLLASQGFNAVNKPLHAAGITLTKAFILNVPLAFLGARFRQEQGVFTATLLTNLIAGTIAFSSLFFFLKGHLKQTGDKPKIEPC